MTSALARVARTVGKLRGRSATELRVRAGQRLAALVERTPVGKRALRIDGSLLAQRLAPGMPSDVDALFARFRSRYGSGFFPGLADPETAAAYLRERDPAAADEVVARARQIQSGAFSLLGYPSLSFGTPIDWHLDPVSGLRAPACHWSRVPYLRREIVGDHKVVWELNRHQYFVTLGQAYWLTGDESFAETFRDHVVAWIDANPPKQGINWASSLEVAFRAMSWLWALALFRTSRTLTAPLFVRILEVLDIHARHLQRYLSTYFSPNTHLTGEALALYQLGVALPELRLAREWRREGMSILEEWLPRQVLPDGVYFEQASQYHRYTADFYAQFVVLARAHGDRLSPHVRPTLEQLLDHLLHLSGPDGTIPLFGDDDGGRLVQLDGSAPHDVRATLAVGAALFARPDFAFASQGDRTAVEWLLGERGVRSLEALHGAAPADTSRAFHHGGYYVMRDKWAADGSQLVFDCGPHGAMNCGHAHADALAVVLTVDGRSVLVDAGTYAYGGTERNEFRSASAHNTLTLDGRSSSTPGSPFQWEHVANARPLRFIATKEFAFVEGEHGGYSTAVSPVTHRRSVLYACGDYWIVRDRVESSGEHRATLRWHLAPGLEPVIDANVAQVRDAKGELVLATVSFGIGDGGSLRAEAAWVSPRYGTRTPAQVLVHEQVMSAPGEILTFLLPSVDGAAPVVSEVSSPTGRAFQIAHRHGEDFLLVKASGELGPHTIATDASCLWLRFDHDGELRNWFALDVRQLTVDGHALVARESTAPWMAGAEHSIDMATGGHSRTEAGVR